MSDIGKAIRKLTKTTDEKYSIIGRVIKSNGSTVDVEPINGDAIIYNVRLQSKEDYTEGVQYYPSIGSEVIVTFINKNQAHVTGIGKLDGIALKVNGQDLSKVIDDLVTAISDLISNLETAQVITALGPAPFSPELIAKLVKQRTVDLTQIKQSFKAIIKEAK